MPPAARPAPDSGQSRHPHRADARRNRELLLAAAREIFSERGTDAPLAEVARRAGIGNATMYRHFPDRRELLIAVYADEVTALCAQGEALLGHHSPGEALFAWLRAFIAHVAAKRDLALAIPADPGGRRAALFDGWHKAMHSAASRLLARARSAGTVSSDLDAADLLALASAIALASNRSGQAGRYLEMLWHGIAKSASQPKLPAVTYAASGADQRGRDRGDRAAGQRQAHRPGNWPGKPHLQ
jgi:AcrR family transcriptional regulator